MFHFLSPLFRDPQLFHRIDFQPRERSENCCNPQRSFVGSFQPSNDSIIIVNMIFVSSTSATSTRRKINYRVAYTLHRRRVVRLTGSEEGEK